MGRTACTEPQCLYSRAIPLLPLWAVQPVQSFSACTIQLYLYSPFGPYGLYRASVPVQGCTLPLTLLLLWAVRPVQNISACTVQLYLYSPYGPYGLYRASVPVQGCTLPLTLLLLWAVRPVQNLSACTTVHLTLTTLSCLLHFVALRGT